MSRNRILVMALTGFIMMLFTSVVQAQEIPSAQELLALLAPRSNRGFAYLLLDIILYVLFAIGFVTMILVPDKQLLPSLIMIAVLGLIIIAKLDYVGGMLQPKELPVLAINVAIFVLPLMVAGMVRSRQGTPRAMWPAVVTGLLGGGYFFLFWALVQRN